MIIRPAQHQDLDSLVEMGARMHAEGAYAFLPYDREKVRRLILSLLDDPATQCALVAEESGVAIGMFGGYLSDYFFCDEKVACDLVLFVDPAYRSSSAAARLIRAFRRWAIEHAARELCLGTSNNVRAEEVGRFYERLGLIGVGGIYKQRLRQPSPQEAQC